MIIAETINEVRTQVKKWRKQGLTVGLVPTMGALHEGHASLVSAARQQCDRVVASVFVNPAQFAAGEDLESYPRDFARDCGILEGRGCDMVFHPDVPEIYPAGFATYVDIESDMAKQLCGKSRGTHFKGVCTVVSKLFLIVAPDKAYFGEKDAQQLAIIRKMAQDMAFDLEVVGCPTVREADGLAKSSRNAYLNETERKAAGVLYQAITAAQKIIAGAAGVFSVAAAAAAAVNGVAASAETVRAREETAVTAGGTETAASKTKAAISAKPAAEAAAPSIPAEPVLNTMYRIIGAEPLAQIEYIEAVDGETLMPVDHLKNGDLVALAVQIGKTRLIDNFRVSL